MVLRRFTAFVCLLAFALALVGCGGDGGEATLGRRVATTAPATTAPASGTAPARSTSSFIATVKPEFCITHYPGTMLVTDRKNTEFAIM